MDSLVSYWGRAWKLVVRISNLLQIMELLFAFFSNLRSHWLVDFFVCEEIMFLQTLENHGLVQVVAVEGS